jgi:hypothetical protein
MMLRMQDVGAVCAEDNPEGTLVSAILNIWFARKLGKIICIFVRFR